MSVRAKIGSLLLLSASRTSPIARPALLAAQEGESKVHPLPPITPTVTSDCSGNLVSTRRKNAQRRARLQVPEAHCRGLVSEAVLGSSNVSVALLNCLLGIVQWAAVDRHLSSLRAGSLLASHQRGRLGSGRARSRVIDVGDQARMHAGCPCPGSAPWRRSARPPGPSKAKRPGP